LWRRPRPRPKLGCGAKERRRRRRNDKEKVGRKREEVTGDRTNLNNLYSSPHIIGAVKSRRTGRWGL
jgi:hypothetical protein